MMQVQLLARTVSVNILYIKLYLISDFKGHRLMSLIIVFCLCLSYGIEVLL
jgi:hypothetical protein